MVPRAVTARPLRMAFPPIGGNVWAGGQNYLRNLVTALCAHEAARVQPVLFADPNYSPMVVAEIEAAGAEIIRDTRFAHGRQARRALGALATGSDAMAAAAYRVHGVDAVFESVTYHGWRFGLPVLTWFPDFQHRKMPHMFGKGQWWRRDIAFRLAMGQGRHVLLSSEAARADMLRAYPGCRATVHVVPFAVPVPTEIPAAAIAGAQAAENIPERWFFLPNQFWQHKNHTLVVEALGLVASEHPDIVVVCTGSTDDPRNPAAFGVLMARVAAVGLQTQFRVLGHIPFSRVQALMQGGVALINPSLFEGWSTTVEEAKALGLPMLLSDIPVHREQTEGRARFFGTSDTAALAAQLVAAWTEPPMPRVLSDGSDRVRFARAFADAALAVAARHER